MFQANPNAFSASVPAIPTDAALAELEETFLMNCDFVITGEFRKMAAYTAAEDADFIH